MHDRQVLVTEGPNVRQDGACPGMSAVYLGQAAISLHKPAHAGHKQHRLHKGDWPEWSEAAPHVVQYSRDDMVAARRMQSIPGLSADPHRSPRCSLRSPACTTSRSTASDRRRCARQIHAPRGATRGARRPRTPLLPPATGPSQPSCGRRERGSAGCAGSASPRATPPCGMTSLQGGTVSRTMEPGSAATSTAPLCKCTT